MREGAGMSERMYCSKRMIKKYKLQVRTRIFVTKIIRATGEVREVSGPHYNTMDADGIDLFLDLLTNTGSEGAKHLNTADSFISIANANPITSHILVFGGTDSRGTGTPTKAAPSALNFYEWHDDSITIRTNQNEIEMWYLDPNTGPTNVVKINHITVNEGTKPANENWHWRIELEMYSTDSDFVDLHMQRFLDVIAGDTTIHMDATRTFFRPFTTADVGLGSTGQNPDAAPTINLSANTITFVTTVTDGNFNGAWDKMEVGTGTTYTSGFTRVRYGGCTTAGGSCGTKVAGEEYEYTYVITLAQGS